MDEYSVFRKYLREKGQKMTGPREIVLRAFLEKEGHVSTEDILSASRAIDSGIGQATVFRTMKLISEAGLARDACRDDGPRLYEHSYRHSHHDHLFCVKCGKIVEFFDQEIERAQDRVFGEYGFSPAGHRLELRGLCGDCAESAGGASSTAESRKGRE